jgi:hypothetical protein
VVSFQKPVSAFISPNTFVIWALLQCLKIILNNSQQLLIALQINNFYWFNLRKGILVLCIWSCVYELQRHMLLIPYTWAASTHTYVRGWPQVSLVNRGSCGHGLGSICEPPLRLMGQRVGDRSAPNCPPCRLSRQQRLRWHTRIEVHVLVSLFVDYVYQRGYTWITSASARTKDN